MRMLRWLLKQLDSPFVILWWVQINRPILTLYYKFGYSTAKLASSGQLNN